MRSNLKLYTEVAVLLLLISAASSQTAFPFCTQKTTSANLYLSSETMIDFAENYIQGYNITYSIESSKGTTTGATNVFSVQATSTSTLNSIVSTSAASTISNQITYSLLESVAAGGYNVYISMQPSFSTAPSFSGNAVTNLTVAGQTCLSTTTVGLQLALVGCITPNGSNTNINTFYLVNQTSIVNTFTFNNVDPSWGTVSAQKVVAFSVDNANMTYLAVISPTAAITPAGSAPINN